MRLLATVDSTSLCADCNTIRTSRSRHCSICGHCVERFDHHCPWINNCIGLNNHVPFYFFIVFMFFTLLISFLQGFTILVESYTDDKYLTKFSPYGTALGFEPSKSVFVIFDVILILVTLCFLFPVGFLVYIQTINLAGGKTTNERMSRSAGASHEDQQIRVLNSGIKNDKRIIYDSNFSSGSFSVGIKEKHGLGEFFVDDETRQPRDTLTINEKKNIRTSHVNKGFCGKTIDNCSIMCCASNQVG